MINLEHIWNIIRENKPVKVGISTTVFVASILTGVYWWDRGNEVIMPDDQYVIDAAIFERSLMIQDPSSEFQINFDTRSSDYLVVTTNGIVSTNYVWSNIGNYPKNLVPNPFSLEPFNPFVNEYLVWKIDETYSRPAKIRNLLLRNWIGDSFVYTNLNTYYDKTLYATRRSFVATNSIENLCSTNPSTWNNLTFDTNWWEQTFFCFKDHVLSNPTILNGVKVTYLADNGTNAIMRWGAIDGVTNSWSGWVLENGAYFQGTGIVFPNDSNVGPYTDGPEDAPRIKYFGQIIANGVHSVNIDVVRNTPITPPLYLVKYNGDFRNTYKTGFNTDFYPGTYDGIAIERAGWWYDDCVTSNTLPNLYVINGQTNLNFSIGLNQSFEDMKFLLQKMNTTISEPLVLKRGYELRTSHPTNYYLPFSGPIDESTIDWGESVSESISATGSTYAAAQDILIYRLTNSVYVKHVPPTENWPYWEINSDESFSNSWHLVPTTETRNEFTYTVETVPVASGVDSYNFVTNNITLHDNESIYIEVDSAFVNGVAKFEVISDPELGVYPSLLIGGLTVTYSEVDSPFVTITYYDASGFLSNYTFDSIELKIYEWADNPGYKITANAPLRLRDLKFLTYFQPSLNLTNISSSFYVAGRKYVEFSNPDVETYGPFNVYDDNLPASDPFGFSGKEVSYRLSQFADREIYEASSDYAFKLVETVVSTNRVYNLLAATTNNWIGWCYKTNAGLNDFVSPLSPFVYAPNYNSEWSCVVKHGYDIYRSELSAQGNNNGFSVQDNVEPRFNVVITEHDPVFVKDE